MTRSEVRQGVPLDLRSKMVVIGDQADQNGRLGTPKNINSMSKAVVGEEDESEVKLKLMRMSDSVLDGLVNVMLPMLLLF